MKTRHGKMMVGIVGLDVVAASVIPTERRHLVPMMFDWFRWWAGSFGRMRLEVWDSQAASAALTAYAERRARKALLTGLRRL